MEAGAGGIVDPDALRGVMRDLLTRAGCPEGAAADTADVLLEADLRGYAFEGCMHLPPLLRELYAGRVNATAQPRILHERPGSALVDGDGGASPVGGLFAAAVAARKAQTSGCCAVGLVNTDPLYMLGYVVDRIAQAGLVGIAMSAGRPRVHPPGGSIPSSARIRWRSPSRRRRTRRSWSTSRPAAWRLAPSGRCSDGASACLPAWRSARTGDRRAIRMLRRRARSAPLAGTRDSRWPSAWGSWPGRSSARPSARRWADPPSRAAGRIAEPSCWPWTPRPSAMQPSSAARSARTCVKSRALGEAPV
jgi:hypothetical protein